MGHHQMGAPRKRARQPDATQPVSTSSETPAPETRPLRPARDMRAAATTPKTILLSLRTGLRQTIILQGPPGHRAWSFNQRSGLGSVAGTCYGGGIVRIGASLRSLNLFAARTGGLSPRAQGRLFSFRGRPCHRTLAGSPPALENQLCAFRLNATSFWAACQA